MDDVFQTRSFEAPDDSVTFEYGRTDFIHLGGSQLSRLTLLPGWHQHEHSGWMSLPSASGSPRVFFHLAGRLRIVSPDGANALSHPGSAVLVPSGSDAWVDGDDPVVLVECHSVVAAPAELSGLWLL